MPGIRHATQIYFSLIAILSLGCMMFGLARDLSHDLSEVVLALLLVVLLVLAERKPMPFGPSSNLLMDTSVVLSAVLLLPSGLAILVAILGPLLSNFPRRTDWYEVQFNTAQTGLQAAVGVGVLSIGGFRDAGDPFTTPLFVFPVLLAGLAMHIVNTIAVSGVFVLEAGEDFPTVWRRLAVPDRTEALGLLTQWAMALLAAVVADVYPWALLLLVFPGLLVLKSLDGHVRLRIRAEDKLVHQAYHDSLTGLPNRIRLTERINEALAQETIDGVTLLFLDLDRFKMINDTLGHEAGDRLLIVIAERLQACVRESDTVARLGGDEFVVLLDGEGRSVDSLAARITEELAAPILLAGREIVVTTSIGVARAGRDTANAGDLLRNADVALYQAKESGRNRVALYDEAMGSQVNERAELEESLRRAITGKELRLALQPQVDLATAEVVSLEALLRWHHPKRGLLVPAEFLDVAEETGLILPIGHWALIEACTLFRHWSDRDPRRLMLSVNIGARQLGSAALYSDVRGALTFSGLPADRLRLEIAENAAMAHPEAALIVLRELRDLGVEIVLDDFGSGRSSLAHLARFPVQSLMLDRALVSGVKRGEVSETVIRAVIGLARELGLSVGAKGIESAEQLRVLMELGCEVGQGHWFGRPGDIAEALGSASKWDELGPTGGEASGLLSGVRMEVPVVHHDASNRGMVPQPA